MSWFTNNTTKLSSTFATLSETVQRASESIKDVIPNEYKESLAKLTLNTEEMINERQHFGEEAKRKAVAKDRLGQLLPWETNDKEREILVEECKDAILELSQQEDTFYGPYEMPLLNVQLEKDDDDDDDEEEDDSDKQKNNDDDDDEGAGKNGDEKDTTVLGVEVEQGNDGQGDHDNVGDTVVTTKKQKAAAVVASRRHVKPSMESLEQLQKLQPLPPLLEEFDLDSHVGLIQRLLKEDPNLVAMQASHSGGGARERVFWNNYFFHCAFTRYEAGLSIDEIWSYQQASMKGDDAAAVGTASSDIMGSGGEGNAPSATKEEETVDFDGSSSTPMASSTEQTFIEFGDDGGGITNETDGVGGVGGLPDTAGAAAAASDFAVGTDFELVDDDDGALDGTGGDPELDELEAEIARELEGL